MGAAILGFGVAACEPSPAPPAPHLAPPPRVNVDLPRALGNLLLPLAPGEPMHLSLRGPQGRTLELTAPAAICGLLPGDWEVTGSAPGRVPVMRTLEVQPERTRRVELKPGPRLAPQEPAAHLLIDGTLVAADLPQALIKPGDPNGLSLGSPDHRRSGVKRRGYDGEGVATPGELRWKVRHVILHAFTETSAADRLKSLRTQATGRHFLMESSGRTFQLSDLVNEVATGLRFQDKTTIHLGLQIPLHAGTTRPVEARINGLDTQVPAFTTAQHVMLRDLLAALHREFPRVALRTPRVDGGDVRLRALPNPRLFRGVLAHFHVDSASTSPGPGLDFDKVLGGGKQALQSLAGASPLWVEAAGDHTRLRKSGSKHAGTHDLLFCGPGEASWEVQHRQGPWLPDHRRAWEGAQHQLAERPDRVAPRPTGIAGKSAGAIIVAGVPFRLDDSVKVLNFKNHPSTSFYRVQAQKQAGERLYERRLGDDLKPILGLTRLQATLRMVVLHADVLDDIETAFHVLHSKGLSTHFGIDFDGTIYQMLDPVDVAYGAAEVNPISLQIDLNNRMHDLIRDPAAKAYPQKSPKIRTMRRHPRPRGPVRTINGVRRQSYGYTDAQYRSLGSLLRTLRRVLPEIGSQLPRKNGEVALHWRDDLEDFHGVLGHFHLTPRRWDPGPAFDWERLERAGQEAP